MLTGQTGHLSCFRELGWSSLWDPWAPRWSKIWQWLSNDL